MQRNIFFEKKQDGIYLYKNFFLNINNQKFYPLCVSFSKSSIFFLYTSYSEDKTRILFKLDMQQPQNDFSQENLIRKIEKYWNNPKISLENLENDNKNKIGNAYLSHFLVKIGFFSDLFQFDLDDNKRAFCEYKYFSREEIFKISFQSNENYKKKFFSLFSLRKKENSKCDREITFILKYKEIDKWSFTKNKGYKFLIETKNINFILLFLDFLYEITYTSTFEDELAVNQILELKRNPLVIALIAKFEYLDALFKIRNERIKNGNDLNNYKEFIEKEKRWVDILTDEKFYPLFTSTNSVFLNIEEELANVMFYTCIGKYNKRRVELFSKSRDSSKYASFVEKHYDQHLISKVSSFYLRRFNIRDAFYVIFPKMGKFTHILVMLILLLTVFGDVILDKLHIKTSLSFSLIIPVVGPILMILWYWRKKINLFKLFLPRLFLGILIGWLSFIVSADLWKDYLIKREEVIFVLDSLILILMLLFIFTVIRNRLHRLNDWEVLRRTVFLFFFASSISLLQGFYIIQFEARDILSVSGFFNSMFVVKNEVENQKIKWNENFLICELDVLNLNNNQELNLNDYCKPVKEFWEGKKITKLDKVLHKPISLYYIWPILFSQFLIAMLIGIVLQLLWEDRPITEPL